MTVDYFGVVLYTRYTAVQWPPIDEFFYSVQYHHKKGLVSRCCLATIEPVDDAHWFLAVVFVSLRAYFPNAIPKVSSLFLLRGLGLV